MIRVLFAFVAFVLSLSARAAVFDLNVFYFTDGITADEDSTHAATLYNFFLGFDLDKKGRYQVGWNYSSHSTESESGTSTVSYSSTQMGPGLIVYLNKDRNFRFAFSYNLVTTGEYQKDGGTAEEWRGTALNADLGYQLRFDGAFSMGIRLNYSSAGYSESVVGTTNTKVSNKKDLIYPSIALTLDL